MIGDANGPPPSGWAIPINKGGGKHFGSGDNGPPRGGNSGPLGNGGSKPKGNQNPRPYATIPIRSWIEPT